MCELENERTRRATTHKAFVSAGARESAQLRLLRGWSVARGTPPGRVAAPRRPPRPGAGATEAERPAGGVWGGGGGGAAGPWRGGWAGAPSSPGPTLAAAQPQ